MTCVFDNALKQFALGLADVSPFVCVVPGNCDDLLPASSEDQARSCSQAVHDFQHIIQATQVQPAFGIQIVPDVVWKMQRIWEAMQSFATTLVISSAITRWLKVTLNVDCVA